jgi:hypothetical protein
LTLGVELGRSLLFLSATASGTRRIDRAKEWMQSEFAEPLSFRLARGRMSSIRSRDLRELEGGRHRFLVGVRLREPPGSCARRSGDGGCLVDSVR